MSARPVMVWWRSIRPFSLVCSAVPALFGSVVAGWRRSSVDPAVAALTVAIAVLLHVITNLTNSLYDWVSGRDKPGSPQAVPILEESPAGVLKVQRSLHILTGLILCAAVWFGALTAAPMVIWPLVGYLGGVYYTKPPIAYKHRSWGAAAVFLLLGLGTPTAAFQAQAGYVDYQAVLTFLPLACLVTAIMLANEIRDHHSDARVGSSTLVVRSGTAVGKLLYTASITVPFLVVLANIRWRILPTASLAVFASLPLAGRLFSRVRKGENPGLDLATARLYGLFGLLYTTAVIWAY